MNDSQLPPQVVQSMREIDEATERLKRAMEDYRRAKADYERARQRLRWNQRMRAPAAPMRRPFTDDDSVTRDDSSSRYDS